LFSDTLQDRDCSESGADADDGLTALDCTVPRTGVNRFSSSRLGLHSGNDDSSSGQDMLDGTSEVITCSLLVILFSGMFEVSACSESGTDAYNGSIALDCIGLEAGIDDGSSGADTSDADLESTMNCSNTAVTAQHKLFTTCEYANI